MARLNPFLDVHETAVQAFIREGGEVRSLMNKVAAEGEIEARLILARGEYGSRNGSHNRSGALSRSVFHNRAKDTGPLQAFYRIGASAKHAKWFVYGTPGTIFATNEWGYMLVPRKVTAQHSRKSKGAGSELFAAWDARGRKGRKGFVRRDSVSGQEGKPFLSRANHRVMDRNGLVLR